MSVLQVIQSSKPIVIKDTAVGKILTGWGEHVGANAEQPRSNFNRRK